MRNSQQKLLNAWLLFGGFLRPSARLLVALGFASNLNLTMALLPYWRRHCYLEHTVAKACFDIFIAYALGQRYAAIKTAVASLTAVEALFVLFMLLPAFTFDDQGLICDVNLHIIFVKTRQ